VTMSRVVSGWMCSQNSNWSKRIRSPDSGKAYILSFGPVENREERGVQHDYSCTCADFQFRKSSNGYCKHIEAERGTRCSWHTQHSAPSVPVYREGEPRCPMCGDEAVPIRYRE